MPLPEPAPRLLRFGLFEVDLDAHELRREGRRVALQEKPFLLLTALVERPGVVVSHDELYKRLWPGQSFHEFELGLYTAVRKLRQALGDAAENPRFVETRSGVGYRFVAPVERPPLAARALPAPVAPRRRPISFWALAGAAIAAVAAITLVAISALRSPPPALAVVRTLRLTSGPGLEESPSWSPDGTRIAYASDQLGQMDIWVRQTGAEIALPLTADAPGYDGNPAWSPDGQWIAFASDREGGGIFVMPALGGPARRLIALAFVPDPEFLGAAPRPAWSPRGDTIAYAYGLKDERGLFLVPAGGGEPRRVPLPPELLRFSVVEPAWSPLGDALAFTEISGVGTTVARIWVVGIHGTGLRALTDGKHFDHHPVWSPDGSRLFFLSDRGGIEDIWWMETPQDPGVPGESLALTTGVGIRAFALSTKAERLVYCRVDERSNVFSLPQTAGEAPALAAALPLTAENHKIEWLDLAPDGRWVAFDSDRAGNADLWLMRTDGTGLRALTHAPEHEFHPVFSPDGRSIAYHAITGTDRDLFVADKEGGPARRLTDHSGKDWLAAWSPDGSELAFNSDRAGNEDVWVVPAAGGPARALTHDPAYDHNPLWLPDGESVVFSSNRNGGDELFTVPRQGGPVVQITRHGWLDVVALTWSEDRRELYVWAKERSIASEARFWTVVPATGEIRPLIRSGGGTRRISAALASSGDRLYFPLWERIGDLYLADLERRHAP